MATKELQPLDKATAKTADELSKALAAAMVDITVCVDARLVAELRRQHDDFAARIEAARKLQGAKATAAVKALVKPVEQFRTMVEKRTDAATDRMLRVEAQQKLSAKVAEAMLAVARIDDAVLAKPLIASQLKHRANLDRIEAMKDDWKAFREAEAALPTIDSLLAAVREAQGMNAWVRTSYRPAAARAAVAAKAVADDRCRKALGAELAAIDAARIKALAAGDLGAAKSAALAALQRLEAVVARIRAVGPAIDRELDRIDAILRKAGNPATFAESLRSLRLHKAGGFPKSDTVEEMDREMTAFETAVTRFAASAAKAAAVAAKTAKAG